MGNPHNKWIWQENPVKRIHSEAEQSEPYTYDPKNNVRTRAICQTCAYRFSPFGSHICACTCMADSGVPRDKHPTNNHCATYMKKDKKLQGDLLSVEELSSSLEELLGETESVCDAEAKS